jgi:hypothetical protein
VKKKGQRTVNHQEFQEALQQIAVKKGLEYTELLRQVIPA